jgi:hypothetical protein
MKTVRVHIRRGDPKQGEDQMVYPAGFNAQEVAYRGLGHIAYSGHIGLGEQEEWTLIMVDDDLATQYDADPDMEIVTEAEADLDIEDWRVMKNEPLEVVTDPNRIAAINAKVAAGVTLSAEDLLALDPDSPIPGIVKRPTATETMARVSTVADNLSARKSRLGP